MKSENECSRAFIDLSQMGRTDWRSITQAVLLAGVLYAIANLLSALLEICFAQRHVYFSELGKTAARPVAIALFIIFGLRLICKKILRRPFRSLISTDMTFDIGRCFLGAALCVPASAVSLAASSFFFSIQVGAPPFRHFEWPHPGQIVASINLLIAIPLFAFIEELVFRAWLTQTLGQYLRSTIAVVGLVSVGFAAAHTQYDLSGKVQVMIDSIGLSALSLRDRRLELAIGAHSMANVCVTLQALFFTGPLPHAQSPVTSFDSWSIVILRGVIPYALMYWLVHTTRSWYVAAETGAT